MKKTLVLVLLFCLPKLMAQQVNVTSGGNAIGSGGNVSYSIGQVADKTQTGTTGTISQGVQQPFEIVILSGSEFENIRLEAVVYPNPTASNVTLKISNLSGEGLNYQLFDIQGKLLNDGGLINAETVLDLDSYPTATYILKVNKNTKALKTFKIIKN